MNDENMADARERREEDRADAREHRQNVERRNDYADFAEQFGEIKAEIKNVGKDVGEIKSTLSGKDGLTIKVTTLENDMAVVHKVAGWILAPAIGSIVLAILGLIFIKAKGG